MCGTPPLLLSPTAGLLPYTCSACSILWRLARFLLRRRADKGTAYSGHLDACYSQGDERRAGPQTTETHRRGQHERYRAAGAISRCNMNDMHLSHVAIGDHLDHKISRREILKRGSAAAAAALAAPVLTTGRAAASTARSSSRSTVTITEWGFGTDNVLAKARVDAFNKAYPHIKVQIVPGQRPEDPDRGGCGRRARSSVAGPREDS
jgi:hypothetical protein